MAERLVVFYDGWCPVCSRAARLWGRLDFLNWLELRSFREPEVVREFDLDLERAQRRMLSRTLPWGREFEGIDAVIQVARRLPVFWPLLPPLLVGRWLGLGQPLYDLIASRRTIIPVGGCSNTACQPRSVPDHTRSAPDRERPR